MTNKFAESESNLKSVDKKWDLLTNVKKGIEDLQRKTVITLKL